MLQVCGGRRTTIATRRGLLDEHAVPLPAIVEIPPPGVTLRIRLLFVSAM